MFTGTQNPMVGKEEFYEFSDPSDIFKISNATYVWNIWKKNKSGSWINITQKPEKMGQKVLFKFGEKVIGVEFKLQVYKATKKVLSNEFDAKLAGEIIVIPRSAKTPKIDKVVLFNQGAKDPNKANYKDSLIARAHCAAMFNQEVEFRLWEDDAAGGGHNATINKNNQLPQVFKARVNEKGIAEVKISLLSNEKVLKAIANKYVIKGDTSEGANHEFYVTASYNGKIQGASKVNVDVTNPNHKAKPKEDSAIFSGTSNQPEKLDKEKKVTHAYFIDSKGNPTNRIKVGDSVRIRVKTNNMIGEYFQYIVWEKDRVKSDDIFRSPKMKIIGNSMDTSPIIITREKFNEGIDANFPGSGDPDKDQQQYFIEIIPLSSNAKSVSFGIDDEAKRTKVDNGISPAVVNGNKPADTNTTCICKEQYKDLIWGGKVSCEFRKKVVQICTELWPAKPMEMANGLMAVMNVETSGSFKAHQIMGKPLGDVNAITKDDFWLYKKDKKGNIVSKSSRAVGLIQFTQSALQAMAEFKAGTGFNKLHELKLDFAKMGELKQLDKVKKYFEPSKNSIKSPEDIYLAVFAPKGVGKSDDYVLYVKGTEEYRQNASVDIASTGTHKNDDIIQRSEILERYHDSYGIGKNNKVNVFKCGNIVKLPKAGDSSNPGFYIYRNGDIKYIEAQNSIEYYVQVTDGGEDFKKINTLTKNTYGLVKFPSSGEGFNRYGGIDTGGNSTIENIGKGDHYLLPQTAAAIFGIISETKEKSWQVDFGDMSSENGSDPTSSPSKASSHHAGHGHQGKQSGLNVDFRYLNKEGKSFQGVSSSTSFDNEKNKELFTIAFKYGFNKNYATGKTYPGVNSKVGGHYDHGHIGALSIEFETVKKLNVKIIQ